VPMRVDLNEPDPVLEQAIKKACYSLGQVRSVRIYRNPHAFALIEMAEREQVLEVAAIFGGSTLSQQAMITLLQTTSVSKSTNRHAF
jgi:hypothetical protein